MTQFTQNAQDTETSSQYAGIRLAELIDQNWHVIDYLRTPANATDVSFGTSY